MVQKSKGQTCAMIDVSLPSLLPAKPGTFPYAYQRFFRKEHTRLRTVVWVCGLKCWCGNIFLSPECKETTSQAQGWQLRELLYSDPYHPALSTVHRPLCVKPLGTRRHKVSQSQDSWWPWLQLALAMYTEYHFIALALSTLTSAQLPYPILQMGRLRQKS